MIVVDTSVMSLVFRRGRRAPESRAAQVLKELVARKPCPLLLPGIVLQELLSGVADDAKFSALVDALGGVRLLLADRAAHIEAARVMNRCAARGVGASAPDCLVAAHAILCRAELMSVDDDFRQIARCTSLKLYRV